MRPVLNLWRTNARLVPKPKVLFRYPAVTETQRIQPFCDDVQPSSEGERNPKPIHFKHGVLPVTLQCFLYGRMTIVTWKAGDSQGERNRQSSVFSQSNDFHLLGLTTGD